MKSEIPLYPDFSAFSFAKSGNLNDIYTAALYYIIITPEIISVLQ
jgi:hypothetical protein